MDGYEVEPYTVEEMRELLLEHGPLADCHWMNDCGECHRCIESLGVHRLLATENTATPADPAEAGPSGSEG